MNASDPSQAFEVRADAAREGLGVFAARPLAAGETIGFFSGRETNARSRMSLQFGENLFVEPGETDPLRNLNHACEPSARFEGRELFAARDLQSGEAITIDYNAHEDVLSAPFECRCGAKDCVGVVRGWRSLGKRPVP
jgi:SET domain-containing protein